MSLAAIVGILLNLFIKEDENESNWIKASVNNS
jgi:xanthine/uracil permease